MPGREIKDDAERTTRKLWKRGIRKYGYSKPIAGIIPRMMSHSIPIREVAETASGFWYASIICLHDPLQDYTGDPCFLGVECYNNWLRAYSAEPQNKWVSCSLFAFLVPD
ncbi:MAG: hypothetical protein WCK46_02960 [Candidatus Adlerbacteria bacterium]